MDRLSFAVKYPFSSEAKKILEDSKISIDPRIIDKAVIRLKGALKGSSPKSSAVHKIEKIEDIASYAVSRMILSYLRNNYLINKFSISEAKRAYSYLNYDSEENISFLLNEFNFKIKENENQFLIHFSSYLKNTPGSLDYRLINRNISKGQVLINKHERLRLLQEAIKEKIQIIPFIKDPSKSLKDAAQSLLSELPKITPTKLSFKKGDNPPCIESLLISLKKHQNLTHQARWYVAVYLINKKMSNENIIDLFSNFPDYNEKICRYQVEHAKKQRYMVPSCATVRGYGLCVANCPIKNPLNWRSNQSSKAGHPLQWKKSFYKKIGDSK